VPGERPDRRPDRGRDAGAHERGNHGLVDREENLRQKVLAQDVAAEEVVRGERRLRVLDEREEGLARLVRRERARECCNEPEERDDAERNETERQTAEAGKGLQPWTAARDAVEVDV